MQLDSSMRRFQFWSVLTVISIYLLILVGGVVRATGSGMGCPDWPRCFGQWIPPTDISELPSDYKQVYTTQRVAKNQRLARTLASLGFKQVAGEIFAHPTQYIETDFNATKTWIEYINRLLGVLIGIFVFVTALVSLNYWRRDRIICWLALSGWLLTGVQGWLGSLVVSTNLLPVMVTIHMGLALFIVAMLLYAANRAQQGPSQLVSVGEANSVPQSFRQATNGVVTGLLWLVLVATFVQIVLGTQVREQVDQVASAADYAQRDTWVGQLGTVFKVHRSMSLLVILLDGYAAYLLWSVATIGLRRLLSVTLGLLALEVGAGVVLAYLALPALVQPVHLTLATLLFGAQFLTLVTWQQAKTRISHARLQPAHA